MTKPSLVEGGACWTVGSDVGLWLDMLSVGAAAAVNQALEQGSTQRGDQLFVPTAALSQWSESVAVELGLPPNCPMALDLRLSGALGRDGAKLTARWLQPGKTIPARDVDLRGGWLYRGDQVFRLQAPLHEIGVHVDAFNGLRTDDRDSQLKIWASIRASLGDDAANQLTDGFLKSLRVVTASAFTWLIRTDKEGQIELIPSLLTEQHSADGQTTELVPALPAADTDVFANRLDQLQEGASAFPVSQGLYVVAEDGLRKALTAVRQLRKAPPEQRKRAALHPEAIIRELLDQAEDAPSVFVETERYADRVVDVADWVNPILPWIKIQPQSWAPPTQMGFRLNGVDVPIQPDQLDELRTAMAQALQKGEASIDVDGVTVPATQTNMDALTTLQATIDARKEGKPERDIDGQENRQDKKVLVIESNFDAVGFSRTNDRQRPGSFDWPSSMRTSPKPHQEVGLAWLQRHWVSGSSGAMLCDDMGLGKTFQALAFCAWLRELMVAGCIDRKPILLVAPVGLLRNWEKEHEEHLWSPGLGDIVRVYGEHVKHLKRGRHGDGTASLDTARISQADVVLANYEAVSDYQLSFGAIRFATVVLDEAQKIKSPGTRVTNAIKAMNVDFFVAMTGTPVENRLADLWCIADAVQPSALGDLKSFSAQYEADAGNVVLLREQVWQEEEQTTGTPKLILRRLKSEKLKGLPRKFEHPIQHPMPPRQLDAYLRAIQQKGMSGDGAMLELIHNMRRVSLHPILMDGGLGRGEILDPAESARMAVTFNVLDDIARKGEKALVFLESLDLQDASQLPTIIARRYGLKRLPMIINGEVGTDARQRRVDLFQQEQGFDVMLLSPKAGGVGLTLTAANHVIHLSRWWNPAVEDQCSDRVYRIGQTKDVHIYYPMAVLPDTPEHSFDLQLQMLMERKRNLARNLLAPPAFTKEDYAQLRAGLTAEG
ncbi:DEAD/DEAH box helicase [Pigmentiphaga litoralis]|uniref:DEAD/DEAH box helicase n=1 Tax=Pigmentiphaga litoralis TaxID=516702 RepID=UPI003B435963